MEGFAADFRPSITDDVANSIFESLGDSDSSLSQRLAEAKLIISNQNVDVAKLKNKIDILTITRRRQQQETHRLKQCFHMNSTDLGVIERR